MEKYLPFVVMLAKMGIEAGTPYAHTFLSGKPDVQSAIEEVLKGLVRVLDTVPPVVDPPPEVEMLRGE